MRRTQILNQQPIDLQKYHPASKFYLFCVHIVEKNEKNGRYFRTEKQGIESASLKVGSPLTKEDIKDFEQWLKTENRDRVLNIRNGHRRDGDYDPVTNAILQDSKLRNKKHLDDIFQKWDWDYMEKAGVASNRFLIVNVDVPKTASNPGAFSSLAVVEFSLSKGIVNEYFISVDDTKTNDVDKIRHNAIRRVFNWLKKIGRSLGESTPAFYTPTGKLGSVFNSLIFVGGTIDSMPTRKWNDSEKKFSLTTDIAEIDILDEALSRWFYNATVYGNGQHQENSAAKCLVEARECANRILDKFHF